MTEIVHDVRAMQWQMQQPCIRAMLKKTDDAKAAGYCIRNNAKLVRLSSVSDILLKSCTTWSFFMLRFSVVNGPVNSSVQDNEEYTPEAYS